MVTKLYNIFLISLLLVSCTKKVEKEDNINEIINDSDDLIFRTMKWNIDKASELTMRDGRSEMVLDIESDDYASQSLVIRNGSRQVRSISVNIGNLPYGVTFKEHKNSPCLLTEVEGLPGVYEGEIPKWKGCRFTIVINKNRDLDEGVVLKHKIKFDLAGVGERDLYISSKILPARWQEDGKVRAYQNKIVLNTESVIDLGVLNKYYSDEKIVLIRMRNDTPWNGEDNRRKFVFDTTQNSGALELSTDCYRKKYFLEHEYVLGHWAACFAILKLNSLNLENGDISENIVIAGENLVVNAKIVNDNLEVRSDLSVSDVGFGLVLKDEYREYSSEIENHTNQDKQIQIGHSLNKFSIVSNTCGDVLVANSKCTLTFKINSHLELGMNELLLMESINVEDLSAEKAIQLT